MKKRVIIAGAAGRDFHNFNVYFRDNPAYEVVAFTAAQIPGISGRVYPKELAGRLYPKGIPVYAEKDLPQLIKKLKVDEVILSYSDLSFNEVMEKASLVLACGASFRILGPHETMLESKLPVIAVTATRTGAGKSTVAKKIVEILKRRGKKFVVIRHPMPYGNLKEQICQRFATYEDLEKYGCTLEEREEYENYIRAGVVVYAGIDYEKILRQAEREAELLVFESGNNDFPLIKPDLYITVVDPLRPEGIFSYPGEVNVRLADIVVINKVNMVSKETVRRVENYVRKLNKRARIIRANSLLRVDRPELIKGKRVLCIDDAPTLTHGGLANAAAFAASKKFRGKPVDPRPYVVGSLRELFQRYPHIAKDLPTLGYNKRQIKDLEKTIERVKCDTVVIGTSCDLTKIIKIRKPIARVFFELKETEARLEDLIADFLK